MSKQQPKVGDKQAIGVCVYCGQPRYLIYSEWNGYGNSTQYGWESDGHGVASGLKPALADCVLNLLKRIRKLEAETAHPS